MKRTLAFLCLLAASGAALAQGAPDLILFNAKVYTVDDAQKDDLRRLTPPWFRRRRRRP